MASILIHAPNIHQGGGRTLLLALLAELPAGCACILDKRLMLATPLADGVIIYRISPNIKSRLREMWRLPSIASNYEQVLFFGNLPPMQSIKSKTFLFLQNKYLIDNINLQGFSLRIRLRISIERLWLRIFKVNINTIIVQTASMQRSVQINLALPTKILPFLPNLNQYKYIDNKNKNFLYIASGEPHKNHRNLVQAWILLAEKHIFPSLDLTLDAHLFTELLDWIMQQKNTHRLNITNHGDLPLNGIASLYAKSCVLIYPSYFESFGLPLLEAKAAGLSIVAAEEDYVRDVVHPDETFNAHSPVSIARSVRRFLKCEEECQPIIDSKAFLTNLQEL